MIFAVRTHTVNNAKKMAIYRAHAHEWKQAWLMLFFMNKSSIVISCGLGLGEPPPQIIVINLCLSPSNTPFLLPVLLIN